MAVNVSREERTAVDKFVAEHKLPYTILVQGDDVYINSYRGRGVPQTYLISPEGKIAYAHSGWSGDRDRKKMEARIDRLLAD